ncbi:hypothetical protein GCM10007878_21180 [Marinospirillum insulare]|uniref:Chain length determinant protein n=2 Tax=Marinospirillum insulare TaxID=217169 RepID=A0ABQ6A092_9GAMM|nr:hypothetical protein GCM10007878_21180 [Marinospirillum insulare]
MLFFIKVIVLGTATFMNTPQIRDAQFQQHQHYDDEISLVDLAKTLIKRRWWVIGTGFVVVALALAFALANRTGPAYNYISIYELAEKNSAEKLETTSSVLEKINSMHWPSYRRNYVQEKGLKGFGELPFTFEVTNPSGTNLILLKSVVLETEKDEAKQLHQALLNEVTADQDAAFKRETTKLTKQITLIKSLLEDLAKNSNQSTAQEQQIATQTQRLFELEDALIELKEGKLIQLSAQDERAKLKKLSGSLVLALGIVLGGILGIMAAFFAEFASQVRQSLKEEAE